MSKRNGKKRKENRHAKMLRKADPHIVQLVLRIHDNFLTLCSMHERSTGNILVPPSVLDTDMILWRQAYVRFTQKYDFRIMEDEKTGIQNVAQWTLDHKNVLANQPLEKIEWGG